MGNVIAEKVLIAGATGMVGANIAQYLSMHCPDLLIRGTYHTTSPFFQHERLTYLKADLTRREDCMKAMHGCSMVVMAAAMTGGAALARSHPASQMTDNLIMDARILEAAALAKVKKLVFLSSATVYQEFSGAIKENQIDLGQDPHPAHFGVGWAKRSAEKLCQFWAESQELNIVTVRLANVFGPFSKFDTRSSNFIPALIRKSVEKMDPFEVWGNPDVVRDVIYVEDVSTAVAMLLNCEHMQSAIFNLGSGVRTTVGDVVQWSLSAAEHQPKQIVYREDKPTTIQFRLLDCMQIEKTVGWKPKISIEEGVHRTTRWWKDNKHWWNK